MDPNVAAGKVLKAIRKNKFETIFGGNELIAITVKRLFHPFLPVDPKDRKEKTPSKKPS